MHRLTLQESLHHRIAQGRLFPRRHLKSEMSLITPFEADDVIIGEVTQDGEILLDDKTYDSPDRAARAVGDETTPGWEYWAIVTSDGPIRLCDLAKRVDNAEPLV
jgi:hypothetical protein